MQSDDLTVRVLIEIRDEIRGTNQRVDGLTQRVDGLTQRVDRLETGFDRLEIGLNSLGERIVHSEIRTATAITELGGTMREVRDLVKDRLDLRDRVERCERDIDDLKRRAP